MKHIIAALPEKFRLRDAVWYKPLYLEDEAYRFRLLTWSFIAALIVPFSLMAIRLYRGDNSLLINYIIPLLILLPVTLHLIFTRNIRVYSPMALVFCILGFLCTAFLPGADESYLVLFFCFPVLAFQLAGYRRGFLWMAPFTLVVAVVVIIQHAGPSSQKTFHSIPMLAVSITAFVLIAILVASREKLHEKQYGTLINHLVYDEITGLPRRDVLVHSLEEGRNYLIAIITIENFRDLGALFGYIMLDNVLNFVADRLSGMETEHGFRSYRLRGHDFCILLPEGPAELSLSQAGDMLYAVWKKLQEAPLTWNNREIRLDYRIGGTLVGAGNRETMLSEADSALKAGSLARVAVNVYSEEEPRTSKAVSSLLNFSVLAENREKRLFRAVYQPIIENASGRVSCHEALVRIRNHQGEYESPLPYLQIAQSTGIDSDISDFMVRQACDTLAVVDGDISVNISAHDMLRKKFLDVFRQSYEQVRSRPGTLIFEITEREELVEADACMRFLHMARENGCKIAIDDFGKGHSNFSNLLYLPIDIVKIDGFLIKKLDDDPKALSIVEGLVSFCNKTGIETVAEFVENEKIHIIVRQLGITYSQGYLFGKPGDIRGAK